MSRMGRGFTSAAFVASLALAASVTSAVAQTAPEPCPLPASRWVTCPNGVRVSAYEPAPDLVSYCEAFADPERNLKRVRPGSPVFQLSADYRTMFTGASGWLIFPRKKDPTDAPAGIVRFFREFGCAPT